MAARKKDSSEPSAALDKARRHLARRDAVLKRLIATVGPCTLRTGMEPFSALVRSIIAQQISSRAAETIGTRLEQAMQPHGLTPQALRKASDAKLRNAGLSRTKALSLRDLASKTLDGSLPLDRLASLTDEEVIEHLVPVRGIGPWTAQMFLIFALGRLDVLPVGDFGLRNGVRQHYGLADLPGREPLETLAEPWRPYRTIGTWYIWRSLGPVPQS